VRHISLLKIANAELVNNKCYERKNTFALAFYGALAGSIKWYY